MGSSVSCLHPSASAGPKRQVMVMKDDGVMLRFKEGSHVKDVLVAHPRHQIIKCSSDRSLLPDSFQLSCNQLYFLLPKGAAAAAASYDIDKSIERLLRIAASRDPTLLFVISKKTNDDDDDDDHHHINSPDQTDHDHDDDGSSRNYLKKGISIRSSRWKPSLQTIPEVTLLALLQADA